MSGVPLLCIAAVGKIVTADYSFRISLPKPFSGQGILVRLGDSNRTHAGAGMLGDSDVS
jgi:hypothetical protein